MRAEGRGQRAEGEEDVKTSNAVLFYAHALEAGPHTEPGAGLMASSPSSAVSGPRSPGAAGVSSMAQVLVLAQQGTPLPSLQPL